ncbi:retrovirus-related pol polyprotein from transposon TNT 1-94 [Tanacetum coccineum]
MNANHSEPNHTWGSSATDIPSSSSLDMTCCPDCSLIQDTTILQGLWGYGELAAGNATISKSYSTLLSKASKTRVVMAPKDHLFSACALGKSKKSSHQPKAEDTNQEKLLFFALDLCHPMHMASINGKRYILVIVDDYSRFTWIRFFRSKDEAPDAIIKCIKKFQVCLNATVRNVRTDNGTEFVNQTLREFYENVSFCIYHLLPHFIRERVVEW